MPPFRSFAVSTELYPFNAHWLERDGAAMHYVDEGSGVPVLLLHGNPTWSFLYRDVIKEVRNRCRCIAPDYPGFGFSAHPPGYRYRPEDHAVWIGELIDRLGLGRIILVMQDWGGPIGLAAALARRKRIAGLVLANTWCWPPDYNAWLFSFAMGGWPHGRLLQTRLNFFARAIVPSAIYHTERKTKEVLAAYQAPFPTPKSRLGTWVFPRAIRKSADWLRELESQLHLLAELPARMVWGTRDPAFGKERYIRRWQRHFPHAEVERLEDASHYVQEDRPDRIANAVLSLTERVG